MVKNKNELVMGIAVPALIQSSTVLLLDNAKMANVFLKIIMHSSNLHCRVRTFHIVLQIITSRYPKNVSQSNMSLHVVET